MNHPLQSGARAAPAFGFPGNETIAGWLGLTR
jgi:hypothetical protein